MVDCGFNCLDVEYRKHAPQFDQKLAAGVRLVMISEACPAEMSDYFDGGKSARFNLNTNQVFNKLGYPYSSYEDYLKQGIYLTTAIKCTKKEYLVSAKTIENCSHALEKELEQFHGVRVMMLMGDFAIKAVNAIWKRKYGVRAIPAGSTYKIRKEVFESNGVRFFPSYTQTGDSFGIEKVKVAMIEEDVSKAMQVCFG